MDDEKQRVNINTYNSDYIYFTTLIKNIIVIAMLINNYS
jgi:hypothetical protein